MDRSNNLSAFNAFSGLLRTFVLISSPFPNVGAKWKNLILYLRVRRDPDALEVWQRYFDAAYYLRTHPDVRDSGIDPCVHFLISGAAERRSPSRDFDVNDYLESYPDVARSGLNPLLHLALFGTAEGRLATQLLSPLPTSASGEERPERVVMVENPVVIRNTWVPGLPLVSVVIPCFNYGCFLSEAIRSVLNQTFQRFEIIVVEGGSTKLESVEEARRLESTADSRVRFYYRTEPHLVGDNRNFGIARARGRYICCLDADDRIAPLYLEIAVFLAEAFGYDLVYPSLQGFGDSDVRWEVNDATFPDILDWNQVTTTALFRKAAWAHVGGYRDWGLGGEHVPEDWDFWIRLVGHGFATKSIHEMMLLYRVHGSGLTSTSDRDLDRQRRALRDANRDLLERNSAPVRPLRRQAIEPLENLLPEAATAAQPGFLLALPYITLGGAERLLSRVGQHIMDSGQRLVVTTSLILSSAMPENSREFERLTSQVYHLRKLFQDEEHARAFCKYLIRRYNVKTLMLTGCEFTYSLLPELKDEFPELRVIDQLFNDTVHVPKNRKYEPWIDATVAPSAAVLDSLVTRFNADKSKIHIVPHGVEIPDSVDHPEPASVNGSGKSNVTIAFFGRLSPEKAPDIFVRIAHKLSGRDDVSFIMTGDGPERSAVQSLIKKCKLENRLNCLGFVDDLEPYLRAADIVVLTSRLDGMPLIVLEAQAREKAVVASRIGSLPHMIEHGETGFLCEPENVSEFCASISRLADDAALRRKIGVAARQSALRHGESRMFELYDAVFEPARGVAMAQSQP